MRTSFFLYLLAITGFLQAQDFQFSVDVNALQLQVNSEESVSTLKSQLESLINTVNWSQRSGLEDHQKIRGTINITIENDFENFEFEAKMFIQAFRPVFGSDQETILLSHIDPAVRFTFDPSRPIIYSENIYTDNLSAIISYYMYLILTLDGDSFSLYGGDKYMQMAQNLYELVPVNLRSRGSNSQWATATNNNRADILTKYTSPRARPFRKAIYEYHRMGLDEMFRNPDLGKKNIVEALRKIEQVNTDMSNPFIIPIFANSKATEIGQVYSIANRTEKNEVYRIMTGIDPANRQKYTAIRR